MREHQNYIRAHRIVRALQSPVLQRITEQLKAIKREFRKHFVARPHQHEVAERFVNMSIERNPLHRAL